MYKLNRDYLKFSFYCKAPKLGGVGGSALKNIRLITIIAPTIKNSTNISIKTSFSPLLLFTNKGGITIPTILEAKTAKLEIAVTPGLY